MAKRGNWTNGFQERFGRYDSNLKQALTNRHVLWLHAVSVGEAKLCMRLIKAIEPRAPNLKFVVSTTTTTGMADLRRLLPPYISKIYYPVDRARCVGRALATVHPEAIVLFETEIWPNFIWRAQKNGIPLFLANARLSERSFRGYRRFAFLFRPLFAAFDAVGAQSEADAARLREVGCRPTAVHVVGNLKYDGAAMPGRKTLDVPGLLKRAGVANGAPILIGGSTHDGEEILLAEIAERLRARFPDLFLILVPRHFERSNEVARKLRDRGVKLALRTALGPKRRFAPGEINCLLVNTTGELLQFYEQATVAFVGKSITAEGGQNPIEPGSLGKAMVFGPNMQNFAEIARQFVARNGALQVPDAQRLEKALGELLEDPEKRAELGRNARVVVSENIGAVDRTADFILEKLKSLEIYVVPFPASQN